jgi:ketosteroid isomerase-like protein
MYRSFFPQFSRVEPTATIEEVEILADWAIVWGTESLILVPARGGPALTLQGRGMTVLRRQNDSSWKLARGINDSSRRRPVGERSVAGEPAGGS